MPANAHRSDMEIQMDVFRELGWDGRTRDSRIQVRVTAGIVALTGTVSSHVSRVAASLAAERAESVVDVINNVVVHRHTTGCLPT